VKSENIRSVTVVQHYRHYEFTLSLLHGEGVKIDNTLVHFLEVLVQTAIIE